MTRTASGLVGVKLGGTIQASRLDAVAMPDIPEIGTMPGDSLLDGIFANLLGPLLAMTPSPFTSGCRTADIDGDGDGLESFCDSDPSDAIIRVDTCIDGDGTIVHDGVSAAVMLSANPTVIAP